MRDAARGLGATGATSCCSSTPSTPGSSRRTRAPPCACSRPPATGSMSPAARRRAAAVLRPHLSRGRAGRRGAHRGSARMLAALGPYVERGMPVVGLEPSCLLTLRDEFTRCCRARPARRWPRARCCSRSSWRRRQRPAGSRLPLKPLPQARAAARPLPPEGVRRHGRDGAGAEADPRAGGRDDRVELLRHGRRVRLRGRALRGLDARWPSWRCCRPCAPPTPDTVIVADGTSCRHQIQDGAQRQAVHVAVLLGCAENGGQQVRFAAPAMAYRQAAVVGCELRRIACSMKKSSPAFGTS